MKPEVDKHLEKIYLDILRNMLKHPEKWVEREQYIISPNINEENGLHFETKSKILTSTREDSVDICKKEKDNILDWYTTIHELNIHWLDFKTRRLLSRLFEYWDKKEEINRVKKTDELLRTSLGPKMDRFLKLTKIKNKI